MKTTRHERKSLRQSVNHAKEVHGAYYETPIENDLLFRLLDDADNLDQLMHEAADIVRACKNRQLG